MTTMNDGIGRLVCDQMKTAMVEDQRMDKPTWKLLRPALPTLGRIVDGLCPLAVEVTPEGINVAQGPLLAGHVDKQVFLFATGHGHGAVVLGDLPDVGQLKADERAKLSRRTTDDDQTI